MGFIRMGQATELASISRSHEFSEKTLGISSFRATPHQTQRGHTTVRSVSEFPTAADDPDPEP